jgi:hypothetical protein
MYEKMSQSQPFGKYCISGVQKRRTGVLVAYIAYIDPDFIPKTILQLSVKEKTLRKRK